jgi:hypothetical protein
MKKSLLLRQMPHEKEQIIVFTSSADLSNQIQTKIMLGSLDQVTAMGIWNFFVKGFKSVIIDGSPVYELTELIEDDSQPEPTPRLIVDG